jgi:AcrR family transcriptional regulator
MARNAPVQARSIASMNRMLDAGEQLFYEGGSAAVTLEAIVERSETSVGSFYARFGDVRGFLDAMHERVLTTLAAEFMEAFAKASTEDDLEPFLNTLLTETFDLIHRHRAPTYFFAVGNSHDQEWRAMGSQFTIGMNDAFTMFLKGNLPKSSSAAGKRKIDVATRMLIAAVFQQIMLDQDEISRIKISQKVLIAEIASAITAYLLATPAK